VEQTCRPQFDGDPLAETAWPPPTEGRTPDRWNRGRRTAGPAEGGLAAEPPVWEAFTKPDVMPVIDRQALLEGRPPEVVIGYRRQSSASGVRPEPIRPV
jgi:hypothetical protein